MTQSRGYKEITKSPNLHFHIGSATHYANKLILSKPDAPEKEGVRFQRLLVSFLPSNLKMAAASN